jgi:hypothetical protein
MLKILKMYFDEVFIEQNNDESENKKFNVINEILSRDDHTYNNDECKNDLY